MIDYIKSIADSLFEIDLAADTIEQQIEQANQSLDEFDNLLQSYEGVGTKITIHAAVQSDRYIIKHENKSIGFMVREQSYKSFRVCFKVLGDAYMSKYYGLSQVDVFLREFYLFLEGLCLKVDWND